MKRIKRSALAHVRSTLLVILGLFMPAIVFAQNYEEMRAELQTKQRQTRQEIVELQNQISQYEDRLNQTARRYDEVFRQFEDLQKLIALKDAKIQKLEQERDQIDAEIEVTEEANDELVQKLDSLVQSYKKTLSYLYKHGRTSELALIMTSESINQMLVRSYYLEQFESYRQEQKQRIEEAQAELKRKQQQLEKAREKKSQVVAEFKDEKQELDEKRKQQQEIIDTLKENRAQLRQKTHQIQQQVEELNSSLTKLIMEEERVRKAHQARLRELEEERKRRLAAAKKIENARERAEEVAKYSEPVRNTEFVTDSELSTIEDSFQKLKGELPWPVENGVITGKIGTRVHSVYGTKTKIPGIEITTEARSAVRVVHDGYVFAVRPFPFFGDLVFVNHGRFKTVYGNLSQVLVRKNAYLRAGDIIGLSGDENSPRGASVFFMIRESNTNLNPEQWIVNK
ncbi:MAG: murein hydrolase activator EnvC family protein [Bacteroidota bacterium]